MYGRLRLLVLAIVGLVAYSTQGGAQVLGNMYLWQDSVKTTTVAKDSFFTYRWESVTIYTDTIDIWYRAGAPDTASWSSRDWMKLETGSSLYFGPSTKLRRFEWKARTGVGFIFFVGNKRRAQF